jgi:hypothetical protein
MAFTWLSTASMPYPQAFNNNSHPPGPPRIHPGFSVVLVMPLCSQLLLLAIGSTRSG